MLITRFRTHRPVPGVAQQMNRLFDSFFSDLPQLAPRLAAPALNAWEDQNNLVVEAELPGVTMDHINVSILNDELTISGSRPICACADTTCLRQERQAGEFSRTISLPFAVDAQRVEARLAHGVLTVTLPKAAAAMPRKIAVQAK